MELFERLIALLKEGTLPIMVPLVLTCLGIGILCANRVLYLYEPRSWITLVWPPARKKIGHDRDELQHAFDAYVEKPSSDHRVRLFEACSRYRTPYARFIERFLSRQDRPLSANYVSLEIEQCALEEDLSIERGMQLLSTLSKAAPLMGLMGTVTGMIATFAAMMVASTSDPKALSSGISIALIATNVGLVVSLPGVLSTGFLSRRGMVLQEEIRLASMRLRSMFHNHSEFTEPTGEATC
ncbi:MAG: MotA/TolQ/ExbB proton channel family protein [Planctomycetota bacterium]